VDLAVKCDSKEQQHLFGDAQKPVGHTSHKKLNSESVVSSVTAAALIVTYPNYTSYRSVVTLSARTTYVQHKLQISPSRK
jgi:hypothetical protein